MGSVATTTANTRMTLFQRTVAKLSPQQSLVLAGGWLRSQAVWKAVKGSVLIVTLSRRFSMKKEISVVCW